MIINNPMRLKKNIALLTFCILTILASCSNRTSEDLYGSWKLDSIHSVYNGFGHTSMDTEHFPLHHYKPEGQLSMTRGDETRYFVYELRSDTLVHKTKDGSILDKSIIVSLSADLLTLKKELAPVFPGKGQSRYEIKYFSRVKE